MAEQADQRLAAALEQLHQDERLTADFTDVDARAIFAWLEGELRAAGDLDDQQFDARVASLRRGVKQAARDFAGDPRALIAAATSIAGEQAMEPYTLAAARPDSRRGVETPGTSNGAQRRGRLRRGLSSRSKRRSRRGWSS